jgi:hypothetical protein
MLFDSRDTIRAAGRSVKGSTPSLVDRVDSFSRSSARRTSQAHSAAASRGTANSARIKKAFLCCRKNVLISSDLPSEAFGFGEGFFGFVEAGGLLQGGAEVFAEVGVVGREFDGSGVFLAALCILAGFKERGGEIGMRFEVVPIGLEDFAKFADGWRASVLQKKCNGVIHAGVEERRFQRESFKEAGFGLREMHFGHLDEAGGIEEFGTVGMETRAPATGLTASLPRFISSMILILPPSAVASGKSGFA